MSKRKVVDEMSEVEVLPKRFTRRSAAAEDAGPVQEDKRRKRTSAAAEEPQPAVVKKAKAKARKAEESEEEEVMPKTPSRRRSLEIKQEVKEHRLGAPTLPLAMPASACSGGLSPNMLALTVQPSNQGLQLARDPLQHTPAPVPPPPHPPRPFHDLC